MKLKAIVIGSLAAAGIFASGLVIGAQSRMYAATEALEHARAELQAAEPNKGGHRERALDLVDRALKETREGIRWAEHHH